MSNFTKDLIGQLTEEVAQEIESLHDFFVGWFTGTLSDESFEEHFDHRFDTTTLLIQPGGRTAAFDQFRSAIHSTYDTNPDFRIKIRNVKVVRALNDLVLATYEEWQMNALASSPSDNGRVSSVLFQRQNDRLVWLHIHETWLPEDVMAAGPFDF